MDSNSDEMIGRPDLTTNNPLLRMLRHEIQRRSEPLRQKLLNIAKACDIVARILEQLDQITDMDRRVAVGVVLFVITKATEEEKERMVEALRQTCAEVLQEVMADGLFLNANDDE